MMKRPIPVKDLEPCLALRKVSTHRAVCNARGGQPQFFDGAFKSVSMSRIRNKEIHNSG